MSSTPDFLMIRNLARDPQSKVQRATRSCRRQTGFILEDGTRLRRRGKRATQIGFDTFKASSERFICGVEDGFIEIQDEQSNVLSLEDLHKLAGGAKAPKPKLEKDNSLKQKEVKPEEPEAEEPEDEELEDEPKADHLKVKKAEKVEDEKPAIKKLPRVNRRTK